MYVARTPALLGRPAHAGVVGWERRRDVMCGVCQGRAEEQKRSLPEVIACLRNQVYRQDVFQLSWRCTETFALLGCCHRWFWMAPYLIWFLGSDMHRRLRWHLHRRLLLVGILLDGVLFVQHLPKILRGSFENSSYRCYHLWQTWGQAGH